MIGKQPRIEQLRSHDDNKGVFFVSTSLPFSCTFTETIASETYEERVYIRSMLIGGFWDFQAMVCLLEPCLT